MYAETHVNKNKIALYQRLIYKKRIKFQRGSKLIMN